MFADDAKVYLRVIDDTDVARLQQAVDALINWAILGSCQFQSINVVFLILAKLFVIQVST